MVSSTNQLMQFFLRVFLVVLLSVTAACSSMNVRSNDTETITQSTELIRLSVTAQQAYSTGAYEQAIDAYSELIVKVPSSAEYWFRLGNSHAQTGNSERAESCYREALVRDPSMEVAWYNLAMMRIISLGDLVEEMSKHIPEDSSGLIDLKAKLASFLTTDVTTEEPKARTEFDSRSNQSGQGLSGNAAP